MHAEQLSSLGGATLAASFGALSADHLEYATEADAKCPDSRHWPAPSVRRSDETAPPVDAGFHAADRLSLRLMLNMGCTLFGMTPEEALAGVTLYGAQALGSSPLFPLQASRDCWLIPAPGHRIT
jgi:imidazolonepropionase